jgi:hypothetical protein
MFSTLISLNPQVGEILTKEDRRNQYLKNRHAQALERAKRVSKGSVRKKKRNKTPMKKEKFTPQLGPVDLSTALCNLANIRGISVDGKLLGRVENLGAFFLAVKDCSTVSGFLAVLFLYLKTEYNKSVTDSVARYVTELLGAEYNPQTGEFGVEKSKEKPKWLSLLKDLQKNWSLVVHNEGFKKISHY